MQPEQFRTIVEEQVRRLIAKWALRAYVIGVFTGLIAGYLITRMWVL